MERTVTVTGQGSTSVAPDTAVVRVAAVARAAGVAVAFAASSAAAAQIGVVARRHTDEKRIGTTGINVWPWHDNQGQQRGFEARHSLALGCPDLDAAGALLDELASSVGDALAVEGVALEVSEPTAARDQAVAAAYADALRQASQLAELAGASLGDVIAIGQGSSGGGGPAFRGMDAMAMSAKIEPGETSVGASLSVTWALV
ncbi:MAG: SIMPL domain-containing protein [Nocardioides sp.]|uniref:SIMPL domain-containing protein n=1 Tax=Nocardioides sp. TaxID=35761 RepID=UPI0032661F9C